MAGGGDEVSVSQAAKLLGRSVYSVRLMIRLGRLKATCVGSGKRCVYVIKRSDLKKIRYGGHGPKPPKPRG